MLTELSHSVNGIMEIKQKSKIKYGENEWRLFVHNMTQQSTKYLLNL